jgi:hypothetical protein
MRTTVLSQYHLLIRKQAVYESSDMHGRELLDAHIEVDKDHILWGQAVQDLDLAV